MSSITELLDELEIKLFDLEAERDELADRVRTLTYLRDSDAASAPTDDDRALTVADLEAAPVGSKLSAIPGYRTPYWAKRSDGLWEDISNEHALSSGDFQPTLGARTLTYPERRGEVIDSKDLRNGDLVDAWADHKIIFEGARIRYLTVDSVVFYDDEVSEVSCYKHNKEFRLIRRPSTEPVTAEDIRASEPGSTFDATDGSVWEWDGAGLGIHIRSSDTGVHPAISEPEDLARWGVTRSSAPSRGDYSAKTPQVGDTITDRHQADTLPAGSVIIDGDQDAFKKEPDGAWQMAGDSEEWDYSETKPPVKLVHIGGGGA